MGQAVQLQPLGSHEIVARSAILPKHFDEDVFSPRALVDLDKLDKNSKPAYAISVASKTLLNSVDEIHSYGCRLAAGKNYSVFYKIGIDAPLEKRSFYCGYFDLSVLAVLNLTRREYDVAALIVPENGEHAHCEIRLLPNQACTQSELKAARGDMVIALEKMLSKPDCKMCANDVAYQSIVNKAIASILSMYP